MSGYEFYPWSIQLWIWGVAVFIAVVLGLVLWLRWGRPLREARFIIEEVDAHRLMTVMDSKRAISELVKQAEAQAVDHLRGVQMSYLDSFCNFDESKVDRFAGRQIFDVDDVS